MGKLAGCALLLIVSCHLWGQEPPPPKRVSVFDAVRTTLLNHPRLRSQWAQVAIAIGLREQQSGAFDMVTQDTATQSLINSPLTAGQLEQDALSGVLSPDQRSTQTAESLSVQKTFRNGIVITPGLQVTRDTDNLFNTGGVNTSTVALGVTIPLLRGRGEKAVAAQENAAKTEVDATVLDLKQLLSQLAANASNSYWNLLAARKNLAVAKEMEERGRVYLDGVQALVKADHVPRNDLNEATANLASRSSTRVAAEQAMSAAGAQLALDMGTSAYDLSTTAFEPSDDFPVTDSEHLPPDDPIALRHYLDEALKHRPDYLAAQYRTAESKTLLNAAKNRLLPELNASLSVGYSGLQEGRRFQDFVDASFAGAKGPNATVGLTYSFFRSNQTARGGLRQAEGVRDQFISANEELARSISADVATSVEAVRNAIRRTDNARISVDSFRKALDGEQEKYKAGAGSIVDILTVEDKLTSALQDQIQAELAYALALIEFRFATGTLVVAGNGAQGIRAETFVTLPFAKDSE